MSPSKKGRRATGLTKAAAREVKLLRRRISYRKSRINLLTSDRSKSARTKRSDYYAQLVELNRELRSKLGVRKSRPAIIKRGVNKLTGVTTYPERVWQFEDKLKEFIQQKSFKKIYIVNVGKMFYVSRSRPSTILYWYDVARNEAYLGRMVGTPVVNVTEDYDNDQLTLHIVS